MKSEEKAPKGRKNTGGGGNPRKKVMSNPSPEGAAEFSVAPSGLRVVLSYLSGVATPACILAPLRGFWDSCFC